MNNTYHNSYTRGTVFIVSDAHLGVPGKAESLAREKQLVDWINTVAPEAEAIVLLGDIFDFWYELRQAVPRGYTRLLGCLAEWTDRGLPIHFFPGNHDMWTYGYLAEECGLNVHFEGELWNIGGRSCFLAHGDGLGPGDYSYKFFKRIFRSPFFRWCFSRLHPNFSFGLAQWLSRRSRAAHAEAEKTFLGEEREWLYQYALQRSAGLSNTDFIFGHRHLPGIHSLPGGSRYINTGDWLSHFSYLKIQGGRLELCYWKSE
ncbi:MAG: UDP-2,3-diacylglucosamine diphosphatase [Flavobacteriales bacterium]